MEAASIWPETRVQMLSVLGVVLQARIPRGVLEDLETVFVVEKPALASGASGIVYKACINESDTTEDTRKVCMRFKIPLVDSIAAHEVPLVLKNMVQQRAEDRPAAYRPEYDCWSTRGECTGYANLYREVLSGRFLNLLVHKGITPHLPVIYQCFSSRFIETEVPEAAEDGTIPEPRFRKRWPCGAIATEMCHMTFRQFIREFTQRCPDEHEHKIPELLHIAFVQIVHGIMCAQTYFNFRHNDLHLNNAMMTYITAGKYRYVVDGQYYDIPNYGMCWKLIDFGFSSSTTLFGCEDNGSMLLCTHALKVADTYRFDSARQPTEMYDIVRFMSSVLQAATSLKRRTSNPRFDYIIDYFTEKLALSEEMFEKQHKDPGTGAVQVSHGRSSLRTAIVVAKQRDESIKLDYAKRATSNAQGSLARAFFKHISRNFRVFVPSSVDTVHTVFSADKPLFGKSEPLRGVEGMFYAVDAAGMLTRK